MNHCHHECQLMWGVSACGCCPHDDDCYGPADRPRVQTGERLQVAAELLADAWGGRVRPRRKPVHS